MQYEHLTSLARLYAAHVDRSVMTVAKRAGLHSRVFRRLEAMGGCRVDTFNSALAWFDQNWPADLEWPRDVPRPRSPKKKEAA